MIKDDWMGRIRSEKGIKSCRYYQIWQNETEMGATLGTRDCDATPLLTTNFENRVIFYLYKTQLF